MKLTSLKVKHLQYEGRDRKVFDGQGLYLHITKSGKYWRYKYHFAKREKKLSIGVFPEVSLKMAREAHQDARALLRKGICPCAEKAKNKLIISQCHENTFDVIAKEWYDYKLPHWKSVTHARRTLSILQNNINPHLGNIPITEISPMQVMDVLNNVKETPETCKRAKQLISSVIDYAVQTGRATYNPAQSLPSPAVVKKKKHYLALPVDEIGEFFDCLKTHPSQKAILGMRLLMLTFVRPSELKNAKWSEIGGDEWHIPEERMKMRRPHVVPLSDWALETLEELKGITGESPYLFPATRDNQKPAGKNFFFYAIRRIGYANKAVPHGFRSLASSILNESGAFSADAIERQLAHVEKNAVRAAYNRAEYMEQRREMMQWYSDFLKARW